MLKIIAPPLGVMQGGTLVQLWEEVDPVVVGLTEADVKALVEAGVLGGEAAAVVKTQSPAIPDLDKMNGAEAIALIHTIHDAELLSELLVQEIAHENRKTVIAAIKKQADSL